MFWPCPDEEHPGTPRLFLDRFATDDGRARFVEVTHRGPDEETDADYPVVLTTGRVLAQYQSGAQTRRVPELDAAAPGAFVELHPLLAGRIGVADGDRVTVTSRRGRATAPARVTAAIRLGHRLHAVPLAGRGPGQQPDEPGARPGVEDARVQGVRGAGGAGDRPLSQSPPGIRVPPARSSRSSRGAAR